MFKVKKKKTGEIYQVLEAYADELYGTTFFLVWENGDWRWRAASGYIPPNYEEEESNG